MIAILEAMKECKDVTYRDVVYMIYKRQEELGQGPEENDDE